MNTAKRIRVLLAEDHTIVREGLRKLLEDAADIVVVGEAATGRQAVEFARTLHPAVVVMDIAMPLLNGLEATRQIQATMPDVKVLILSAHSDDAYVEKVLELGAKGYLIKQTSAHFLAEAIRAVHGGGTFFSPAKAVVKGSVVQGISFLLIFYLLFFFFRDRRMALQAIRSLSPLTKAEMDHLLVRIGDTICATIYGTLTVAAVQGLLGGLMFWCLGLSAPLFWGVLMAILAIVPVLGAFVVWIPATVFLALNGSWGKALILAIWGAAVVSTVDNLLRPMLIGNRLKLHTVLAFMSMLGGIILFGSAGLILGPVVLTITTVLIKLWQKRSEPEAAAI
jgi:predicted PurR-regulated permease PerM